MKETVLLLYLAYLSFSDVRRKTLSVPALLLGFIAGVLWYLLSSERELSVYEFLGGITIGGGLFLFSLCTRGKIGSGDALLFSVIGVFWGAFRTLGVLWGSFCLAGLYGLICLVTGKKKKTDAVPFVPFVLAAYVLSLF